MAGENVVPFRRLKGRAGMFGGSCGSFIRDILPLEDGTLDDAPRWLSTG